MEKNYLDLLDELRSIAQLGINHTKDPFDLERYKKLLRLSADGYSEITNIPAKEIEDRFNKELGMITPKLGVNGVLFNDDGQMFLEKRSDDGLWGIPGGWVDAGEGPEMTVKREFMEEADLVVEPVKLIKVFTRLPGAFNQPHTSVHLLYYCKYISGDLQKSHESLELKYMDHNLVTAWHKDHQEHADDAMQYFLNKKAANLFS